MLETTIAPASTSLEKGHLQRRRAEKYFFLSVFLPGTGVQRAFPALSRQCSTSSVIQIVPLNQLHQPRVGGTLLEGMTALSEDVIFAV